MKKRVIQYLVLVVLFTATTQSCKKDEFTPQKLTNPALSEVPEGYFDSERNPNGFSDRITYQNKVVMWENENKDSLTSSTADTRTGDDYSDIFWLHVADIRPYVLFGETLSATHIDFYNDKAYVSYHKRGNTHLGALEIIDLSDPAKPKVTFKGYLSKADVNAITVGKDPNNDDINIWLALSDKDKGAVLGEIKMTNGTTYSGFSMVNLSNHIESGITSSANSVTQSGEYLYVSSGKTYGGAFCLDADDLAVLGSVEFQNGKYIDVNTSGGVATKVVSLQTGEESSLRVEDIGAFHFSEEHQIGEILHQNVDIIARGKSVLHFTENNPKEAYVTMGMNGLSRINIDTGEETWHSPADMITTGNTNGLTSDGEFIYVANGADGLTVFTQPEIGESPERVFQWDLDDATTASANMVQTHNEWIFVAKGQGGVKILKRPQPGDYLPIDEYDALGKPANLADDQPTCNTLLSNIFNNFLPEGVNAKAAHPEFFKNNVPTSIVLNQDAEISVSFIHEGAGYNNVLGYYYYDGSNPPSSVDELTKLIVFPNASAEGSGGGLLEGNTVELLGNFKAGTVVGFFINSNGWDGTITEGYGGQYTERKFNQGNKYQSVLMYDADCDATIIGFEDIYFPQSDKDFNDALFQIRTYPNNAYNVNSLNQL